MNPQFETSGTNPSDNNDNILAEELEKLKVYRNSVAENNKRYVDAHPELQQLLDDFVTSVITHKPPDIINFGLFFFNNIRSNGRFGPCPVVIAGPSGVGKGAIINRLLTTYPDIFGFSVSHTTRPPRPGEIDGVHYNFVTKGEFEEAVERGDFVEYAKVHTNFYGTSLQAIEKVRAQNKICILDIDIQGVQSVKKSKLDFKCLFVTPPSMKELENRLRGRNTETMDKIKIRLDTAVNEIAFGQQPGNFNAVIVNDNIDDTLDNIVQLFQEWFPELDLYVRK
jgi:guanylate kinase